MTSIPRGVPRPGDPPPPPPPNSNHALQPNSDSLPNNFQNLNLNQPPLMQSTFAQSPPFPSHGPPPVTTAPVNQPSAFPFRPPSSVGLPMAPPSGVSPATTFPPGRQIAQPFIPPAFRSASIPGGPQPSIVAAGSPPQPPRMHSPPPPLPPPLPPPPQLSALPGGQQAHPGAPYGSQPLYMQPQPVPHPALAPGSLQQPSLFGMSQPLLNQSMPTISPAMGQTGAPVAGPSKIDVNQIPRPISNSSLIVHETRHGNQANPPPPATSDYIVKDTGNCSPRYLRCTINQIPCTVDLLTASGMQLALLVQPFALPHPSEEPIQVVNFGESGPIRCSRCKGYINPFMKFIDQGRQFICNLCGFTDETPQDYHCNLGPDGRRRDADERPELCRGTVEFVASKEYMVRDPMPTVYFFLIDVSMMAIQTGATAAACSAISQVISELPERPRTAVGIATFDSSIHFYNINRVLQQPLMLIVPDVDDVYTPLQSDIVVQLSECRQHLELLLESIPTMFQHNRTADSAFGAAIKAAFLAIKSTGGKLLVFQSVLPSKGIGAFSARDAEGRTNISAGEKEAHKLLQPAGKTLKTMAIEFAEYQVCVDVFITTQTYIDIASISVIPRTTGGQVYYYHPFSALSDPAKLYNDLKWNVTRPQGFEAVMRMRCSQGIQVQEYHGNFCKRIPTDVDLPGIDCDKTIMVTLKHDDKLQDGSECSFQCALLYTTLDGQRRIRVTTLSLPCTNMLNNLFRSADLDTQFVCMMKQVSSSGQLILPETLKLLPLYILALIKSTGLRADGKLDERSFWINHVSSLSIPLAVPFVYARMVAIHDLNINEKNGDLVPCAIPLSSENISNEGIYLLENGEDCLIYSGNSVDPDILQQLFGTSTVDEISNQFVLQQYDNPLSKRLNDLINEIRRQRCSYLRLKFCKKGEPSGMLFFSCIVEDKSSIGLSYVEFLMHIHRQIQMKM